MVEPIDPLQRGELHGLKVPPRSLPSNHLRLEPDNSLRFQTYTHPLWMLMLTAVYLVVGNVYYAAISLSVRNS